MKNKALCFFMFLASLYHMFLASLYQMMYFVFTKNHLDTKAQNTQNLHFILDDTLKV